MILIWNQARSREITVKFRAFFKDSLGHEGVRDFEMSANPDASEASVHEDARTTAQGLMPVGARLERVEKLRVSDDG